MSLPEGLVLVEDFVSHEEESSLLAAVDWTSTDEDDASENLILLTEKMILKDRDAKKTVR